MNIRSICFLGVALLHSVHIFGQGEMPKDVLHFLTKYNQTIVAFESIQDLDNASVEEIESLSAQLPSKKLQYAFLRCARIAMKQARKEGIEISFLESLYNFVTQHQQELLCLHSIKLFEIKYAQVLDASEEGICFWATNKKELKSFVKEFCSLVSLYKKYTKASSHLEVQKYIHASMDNIQSVHDFLQEKGFIKYVSGLQIAGFVGLAGVLVLGAITGTCIYFFMMCFP
ncbi:hypothetical protein EBR77_02565 [bacterium]|nr:hypothetical protein [bacterium]NBX77754.1 hypothetical protein [bacterium]